MSSIITMTGLAPVLDTTPEALAKRDHLLALAKRNLAVTDAATAESATAALKEIKAFTRSIETSRTDVKAPILDLSRKVDTLAKTLTSQLEQEADRISRSIGAWQAEERRKEEEARRKAWEEEQRIKAEAEAKLREAEARSRTQASFEKKAAKIEEQTFDAIAETRAAVATAIAPKPAGLATRKEVVFEVTDIIALYEAAPGFVVMTPNHAAIKAALKAMPEGQKLPGVTHRWETKSFVR